jgi:hypothetical protein
MKRSLDLNGYKYHKIIKLYTATLIIAKGVIPVKPGIQKITGFQVKPGMTDCVRLMSSCIETRTLIHVTPISFKGKGFLCHLGDWRRSGGDCLGSDPTALSTRLEHRGY